MAAFILILLETYIRPSELLALRKKDLFPPLVPLLVGRDLTIPKWSVYQDRGPVLANAALAPAIVWKSGGDHLEFR